MKIALTLALLLPACAIDPSGSCALQRVAELPLQVLGTVPLVTADINGRRANLVLDTGSDLTVLNRAAVLLAFVRPAVLRLLRPRDGYDAADAVNVHYMGFAWFLTYLGLLVLMHHLAFFLLELGSFRPVLTPLPELGAGEVGEIVTRGPQVFLGYWQNPQATQDAFVTLGGRPFFRTGDLAYTDDDGYFFFVDRLKRMVNVGGMKVWPAEVEAALHAHPAVQEAVVISVPDERMGERARALLVLRAGESVTEAEFIEWARTQMAHYKAPREVRFVDSLPKGPTGKVTWRQLQEAARAETER